MLNKFTGKVKNLPFKEIVKKIREFQETRKNPKKNFKRY